MKLIFATNNRHKLEEAEAILGGAMGGGVGGEHGGEGGGFELVTPRELGIAEDIPETGNTLEENALQKARYVFERVASDFSDGIVVMADDSGLEVDALGGAPGVFSARYAAVGGDFFDPKLRSEAVEHPTYEDNNRLLLKNLEGEADRSARFRTVVALVLRGVDGGITEHLFEGAVEGRITDEFRGGGGFGYDPVFVPDLGLCDGVLTVAGDGPCRNGVATGGVEAPTFAEMGAEQKNAISHRARAMRKVAEFLRG